MNMNRANRAGWQKGYLSIPTQFWQVTAKFMENIMPEMLGGGTKAWTGRQKAQVLTGQLALFGAAGVPLGDSLYNTYLDFTGTNPADVSAQEALAVKQGLMGVVSKYMTGGDIEVSERFAFGSGFNQLIETFFRGDKTFGEIASGAAGVFPERVIQAAAAIYPRISDPEYSLGDITAIGNELGSLTSTWRNGSKALLMNKVGEIRTSGGEVVDRFNPEHNMGVIWAQAAGFQPSALSEYYDLKNYNRAVAQLKTDVLKSLESNFRQYLTGDVGDPSWQ